MCSELRRGTAKHFWLRIFASHDINVEQFPETNEMLIQGAWEAHNTGGMMHEAGDLNPHWCLNPQYFLYFNQPTHFKVITS